MHTVLNAALPVFGLILLGFLAGRSGRFEPSATDTLNRFAFYFALPAGGPSFLFFRGAGIHGIRAPEHFRTFLNPRRKLHADATPCR